MRLGWLSDLHLNFLQEDQLQSFIQDLSSTHVDAWLISGDLAEAPTIVQYLQLLQENLGPPIYFVLGNHDFYRGSFARVHEEVDAFTKGHTNLHWLTTSQPASLSSGLTLIGDDAWGDARLGDPEGSQVVLNDFHLIQELTSLSKRERIAACRNLGDRAADRIRHKLDQAAASALRVVIVTHVPPFSGAAWHEGKICEDDWLPWFSCSAMGEVILECAHAHPGCKFTVLCGHTHGGGHYQAAPNVGIHTAEAEYGVQRIQEIFEFE
jgi:3',5'-cyclic-AMP phosphodiesterase